MSLLPLRTVSASLALLGCASLAHGAGFNLLEQSGTGLGAAYAGSAALAEDASTIYYNPAGLMRLEGLQLSAGFALIKPSFRFKNDGRSTLPAAFNLNPPPLRPSQGGNGGNAGSLAFLPNLYASYRINHRVAVGLGISAPFGLKTEYDNNWMGRFHSRSFDIKTINVNPSVAFKLADSVSMGIGLNIQFINATYAKATVLPTGTPAVPFSTGNVETKIDNVGMGWNVGFLFEPSENTRFGISYRSRVKQNTSGHTTVTVLHPVTGSPIRTIRSDASASVSLPDLLILSAYHRLNEKWEMMGDISWTGWSSIPKLTIKNKTLANATLDLRFKDAWRVAMGARYQLNDRWKLTAGVAWDQSPVRVAEYRPASLPDKDRYWLSIGAQYKASENTTIDIGYTHLLQSKAKVDNTNNDIGVYGRLSGTYKANAHILGVQLSHRF